MKNIKQQRVDILNRIMGSNLNEKDAVMQAEGSVEDSINIATASEDEFHTFAFALGQYWPRYITYCREEERNNE